MKTIENKWKRTYFRLIERCKDRTLNEYTEKHHILPRSLGGGNDDDNLVKLTPREHYIAHLLLPKFTLGNEKRKMLHALHCFIEGFGPTTRDKDSYAVNSRIYESFKKEYAKTVSERMKNSHWTRTKSKEEIRRCFDRIFENGGSWNFRKNKSSEEIEKINESLGRSGKDNHMFGKSHSEETKKRIRETRSKTIEEQGMHSPRPIEISYNGKTYRSIAAFGRSLNMNPHQAKKFAMKSGLL
jgi:hypothetical protein